MLRNVRPVAVGADWAPSGVAQPHLGAPLVGGDAATIGARCLGLAVPLLPAGSLTCLLLAWAGGDVAALLKKWALAASGPLCAGPRGPKTLLAYGPRQLAFGFLNPGVSITVFNPCPGAVPWFPFNLLQ